MRRCERVLAERAGAYRGRASTATSPHSPLAGCPPSLPPYSSSSTVAFAWTSALDENDGDDSVYIAKEAEGKGERRGNASWKGTIAHLPKVRSI